MKKSTVLVLLLVVALLSSGITYYISQGSSMTSENKVLVPKAELDRLKGLETRFSKLLLLEEQIKQNFYKDTKDVNFDEYIIKGLFAALQDPYSVYYNKDEFKSLQEDLAGSFVGIGTFVEKETSGAVRVVSPIKGSPAFEAGIKSNDLIYKVDDVDITTMTIEEAVKLMKGDPGTKVKIDIIRDNKPLTFNLERREIIVPSVEYSVKENGVGYIQITSFEEKTAKMFSDALNDLKSQNITSLIIDLRGNGGGSLLSVEQIADMILGDEVILSIQPREGNAEVVRSDGATKLDLPLAVLVDGGSASASEILAGAIQDTKTGVVIGQKTFGKGIVQNIQRLADGTGFKITTDQWLTPNGNTIHKKGIEPNLNLDALKEKGYTFVEDYEMGSANDIVLNFAIDYLNGKVK